MLHILIFLRPLRYLNPGTGSILVQLIVAALGGGLFFFIKSKWNAWFKKGKKKQKPTDDIELNPEDENIAPVKAAKNKPSSAVKASPKKKPARPVSVSKKTRTTKSKKQG